MNFDKMDKCFRGDIEGLRCIAVLSVLFFHIDPHWLPGGFIGVDIFFVISGYLISRNILKDLSQGSFRFKKFYVRRFRRLYPALLATVISAFALGWKFLSPTDLVQLSKSAFFCIFGLSNYYFYSTVDYFNDNDLVHPLLHTWSLGIEEQFYLFWPLLLVLAFSFHKKSFQFVVFFNGPFSNQH